MVMPGNVVEDRDAVQLEEEHEVPADYDSWYSGLISFLFHLTLILLVPLLAALAVVEDRRPPEVGTIQVSDGTDAAAGEASEMDDGALELMEETPPSESQSVPTPLTAAAEIESLDNSDLQVNSTTEAVAETLQKGRAAAARARSASQRATDILNKNLGGTAGGNGSGGTGRAGRASRWVLTFNSSSGDTYLNQLGGLGADVAFPVGEDAQYFTDLAGSRRSSRRSLHSESRIYWIDDATFRDAARVLGHPGAPLMYAFLPTPLEEKMAQLELAEARRYGVTREEDIQQTIFECVARGGSYDVQIVSQTRYK